MTLTKADLAAELIDQVGLSRIESKDFVDAFFEEIRTTLEGNEPVKLSGFGNYQLIDKNPRPGRNPKTGENRIIKARRVVTFLPSPMLKDPVTKNFPG